MRGRQEKCPFLDAPLTPHPSPPTWPSGRLLSCQQAHAGSNPAVGSALPEREAPLECDGPHATLRRSKSRFDSWQGQCLAPPASVAEGTAVFEAARLGSTPRRGKGRPRGVPESHTTLRRSRPRFDSWRGHVPPSSPSPGGPTAACRIGKEVSAPTRDPAEKRGLRGAVARSRRHVK